MQTQKCTPVQAHIDRIRALRDDEDGNRNDDEENVENLDVVDEPADLRPAAVLNDKLPTSKPANVDLAALSGSVACNDQA